MNLKPEITLKEALELLEKKQPVNIIYRKANWQKKTAGERAELNGVILHGQDWPNQIRTFIIPGAPEGNNLRDVHIRLMIYINGRRIIY